MNKKTKRVRYNAGEVKRNLFYKFPKFLALDPDYQNLDVRAKYAYMLLLDRHQLSLKNGFIDDEGYVFIIFPRQELQGFLNVSKDIVTHVMYALIKYGLVEEKRQGQGKPNIIYLLSPENPQINFQENIEPERLDTDFRIHEKGNQKSLEKGNKNPLKRETNFPEKGIPSYSKNDLSNTDRVREGATPLIGGTAAPLPQEKENFGDMFKNVWLHRFEYDGLCKLYGAETVNDYVNRLDEHIADKGKPEQYPNHYATIYKWINQDRRKSKKGQAEHRPKTNRFNNFESRGTDYSKFEELDRLIKIGDIKAALELKRELGLET